MTVRTLLSAHHPGAGGCKLWACGALGTKPVLQQSQLPHHATQMVQPWLQRLPNGPTCICTGPVQAQCNTMITHIKTQGAFSVVDVMVQPAPDPGLRDCSLTVLKSTVVDIELLVVKVDAICATLEGEVGHKAATAFFHKDALLCIVGILLHFKEDVEEMLALAWLTWW